MNYLNLLGVSSAPSGGPNTGWLTAGTITDLNDRGVAWTDLANIRVPDGIYGTASVNGSDNDNYTTHGTWFSNFGASIPSGSTITGLELRVKGRASAANRTSVYGVFTPSGTIDQDSLWNAGFFTTSDGYLTVGGPEQLFGLSLTQSIVTESDWGFIAWAYNAFFGVATVFLDSIEMKIYYTPP